MKKLAPWERRAVLALALGAWALRWIALREAPPGWRDDALINIYALSLEVLSKGPTLYFTGASGHEPLYHTLHALLIRFAGINAATGIWLSAAFGTLGVLLTWALGRRMFTPQVGLTAGALVAVSFWSLMYSRIGLRHIATPAFLITALYWQWRLLRDARSPRGAVWGIVIGCGAALLTYYAGRLVPVILLVTLPLAGARPGRWRRCLLAIGGGILLSAPMFWATTRLAGADARVGELAVPLHALLSGDPGPLLEYARITLGMFHAAGDPEWLYNIAERPVFGAIGAAFFFIGILTRLGHLNQPNSRLLLVWLAAGISPAFLSTPPASLGHTILALPIVYLLAAMPVKAAARRWPRAGWRLAAALLLVVTLRDVPDYFRRWPQASMVRFLYRADYRALAQQLDAHPEVKDAAVGSFLYGPWDQVAVETDLQRNNLTLRWFDPERALVGGTRSFPLYLPRELHIHPQLKALLDAAPPLAQTPAGMRGVEFALPPTPADAAINPEQTLFNQALTLRAAVWETQPTPGSESWVATWWEVQSALPLPPEELIANPPPPGVYNGPRLKVFAHLLTANGTLIAGDDGLWVDPYRLQPGDRFVQWHRFDAPVNAPPGPYRLEIGLYDPLTGARWTLPDGRDTLALTVAP